MKAWLWEAHAGEVKLAFGCIWIFLDSIKWIQVVEHVQDFKLYPVFSETGNKEIAQPLSLKYIEIHCMLAKISIQHASMPTWSKIRGRVRWDRAIVFGKGGDDGKPVPFALLTSLFGGREWRVRGEWMKDPERWEGPRPLHPATRFDKVTNPGLVKLCEAY